jgi:hypothetical protein
LIDLTGKAFGKGCGNGLGIGRQGRVSQIIGTITPCALTESENVNAANTMQKIAKICLVVMMFSKLVIIAPVPALCLTFKGTRQVARSCTYLWFFQCSIIQCVQFQAVDSDPD